MTLKKHKALLSDCCTFVSQQNSVNHVVTSSACSELTQVPAWADLCDRWSDWNGILPRLTGRNQSVTGIPPFPSCCVVGSGPRHCIYILCMLRLCCLLEILNSGGMLSGHDGLLGPPGNAREVKETIKQVIMTGWPCFLCCSVGTCSLAIAAATVHLMVPPHTKTITWDFCTHLKQQRILGYFWFYQVFSISLSSSASVKNSVSVYPSAESASQQYKWS